MRSVAATFAAMILAAPLWAETPVAASDESFAEQPVLVELFTSQGCASCPPADAFMHQLAARDDVVALALHVDYWDYIFDDVFGKAAHTKRQYGYADASGRRMVYTPQMIIGGKEDVVGNRPQDVNALIERHLAAPPTVALEVRRESGDIIISAQALTGTDAPMDVLLARFIPQQDVAIDHGENAGQTYSYANIVTDLRSIGQWDPRQPLSMKLRSDGDEPVVVIVQQPAFGPVEAVALLR
ncbi:DUF1223 domain-containing protein [Pelagivirga sediminicola]|uniref:DUF1223 domain-containing protein n=1 Tax=Pelagivirga sediminicola TaxID=2170575 RepID=A0A2T7G5V3_9RHOB|nr:DUF1223 domain-containing protein [Pelagivirga sediminicola]PVA09800.1 DUF1223 domain-containing protein [Pelagivirga sediminicola]